MLPSRKKYYKFIGTVVRSAKQPGVWALVRKLFTVGRAVTAVVPAAVGNSRLQLVRRTALRVRISFLCLAVWMDLYSGKIIGWQPDNNMKEELVVAAFTKAMMNRNITKGLLVHSDRGGQYAGSRFRKLIDSKQMQQA